MLVLVMLRDEELIVRVGSKACTRREVLNTTPSNPGLSGCRNLLASSSNAPAVQNKFNGRELVVNWSGCQSNAAGIPSGTMLRPCNALSD